MVIFSNVLVHYSMVLVSLIRRLAKESRWLAVLLIMILNNEVLAQPSQPQLPQFSVGVFGGPSLNFARYGDRDLQKHYRPGVVPGYSAGAFVKFPLKDRYSFITEGSFGQKGRSTNFNENWNNRTIYYMVGGAMALRKSFQVKWKKNTPINLFVGAGPNIDYILKAHGRIKVTPGGRSNYTVVYNGTPDSDFRYDYYVNANRWLFGLDLRAGGDAPLLSNQRLYVEFRFTWGQTFLGGKNSSSYMEIIGYDDNLQCNIKTLQLVAYYALDFDLKRSRMGRSTKDKEVKRRR
jgi:hypothetical protein